MKATHIVPRDIVLVKTGDYADYENPDDTEAIIVPGHTISSDMKESDLDFILNHRQIVFSRTSPQYFCGQITFISTTKKKKTAPFQYSSSSALLAVFGLIF